MRLRWQWTRPRTMTTTTTTALCGPGQPQRQTLWFGHHDLAIAHHRSSARVSGVLIWSWGETGTLWVDVGGSSQPPVKRARAAAAPPVPSNVSMTRAGVSCICPAGEVTRDLMGRGGRGRWADADHGFFSASGGHG